MLVVDTGGKKNYDRVGKIWQCDHLSIVTFDF